jgi:hypothetical protein
MISLGREPQEQSAEKHNKPRSGDRHYEVHCCDSRRSSGLSPLQGSIIA